MHLMPTPSMRPMQAILAGKEARDSLRDVVAMLANNASNPQVCVIGAASPSGVNGGVKCV